MQAAECGHQKLPPHRRQAAAPHLVLIAQADPALAHAAAHMPRGLRGGRDVCARHVRGPLLAQRRAALQHAQQLLACARHKQGKGCDTRRGM